MFGTKAHRAIAGAGIAVMIAVGAGACGGGGDNSGIDKAALISKVKSDSNLKSSFNGQKDKDKAANCVVDAALKYGDKDKLKDYLDGKGNFEDTVSKDNTKKANAAVVSCVK